MNSDVPPTATQNDALPAEHAEHALRLADDLRDRVSRERAAIRRLRAYLDRTVDPLES